MEGSDAGGVDFLKVKRGEYIKSGAIVGYLEEVTEIYLPRPDEKFAGSKAYQENKINVEKTYKI